jgi:hypothetical protein
MSFKKIFWGFKLGLPNNSSRVFAINDAACASPADLSELATDFFRYILGEVKEFVQAELLKHHSIIWDKADIHAVLSVPTVGSNKSRTTY